MNEQTLLTKLGFSTHKATADSITITDWERFATCSKCGLDISAFWVEDEDRLSGWSTWKATSGLCQA
jgi:hypothetical protein